MPNMCSGLGGLQNAGTDLLGDVVGCSSSEIIQPHPQKNASCLPAPCRSVPKDAENEKNLGTAHSRFMQDLK